MSDRNEYTPWEQYGETELDYYKRLWLAGIADNARLQSAFDKNEAARVSVEEFSHAKSDLIAKQDKVIEAARAYVHRHNHRSAQDWVLEGVLRDALRALDGEP